MNIQPSDQAQAALDAEGPILVQGGPGSGKTTLALLKAQRLIPTLRPGQEVLFLSFSRAAVRQVLIRCRDVLSGDERRLIAIKTYHAFCMELIKSHGRLLTGQLPRIAYPTAARLAKSAHDGDWHVERERLAREEGIFCFDQFAPASVELISRARCVLELVAKRYPVIILDEFQDTDDAQWELVKLLSQYSCLITLADPDQRIFEYDLKVNPQRLSHLRESIHPVQFDLGAANHRSPDASILSFADAVLRNQPLPQTSDVTLASFWGNSFQAGVHAHVVWVHATLRKLGLSLPTVAVLCRANSLVADVSGWLNQSHSLNGVAYPPVDHHVVWDAELTTAAAQVVASILEWPQHELSGGIGATFDYIANYYDLKNAGHSSSAARTKATSFRAAATAVRNGREPRPKAAKQLVQEFKAGVYLRGDTEKDWVLARSVMARVPELNELSTNVRFVRLFRASDEIAGALGREWVTSGNYGNAVRAVHRALEMRRVLSANVEPAGIVLMTMHKAKGKEFDGVVVVEGQHKGTFFGDPREPEPYEATRRLLRVAITRARHKVIIVRPAGARPLVG